MRRRWLASGAALTVMPALTLAGIAEHGVNVPFFDQWSLTRLFRAEAAGTLGFGDFWAEHNEHRPLFPRAIEFGLAHLTRWDIRAELYLNFAVALATFAVMLLALRRSLDRLGLAVAGVVASALFFSPVQWENWLWGWELQWFLANLMALIALWALTVLVDRRPAPGLALAAACAFVATFSLGQGLLLWPVGLALLLFRRRPWRAWAVVSLAVTALYFAGWDNPGQEPSKTLFLEQPIKFGAFVCVYLGRWFAVSQTTGALAGAVLIVAFAAGAAYVVRHRENGELVDRTVLWIGLGLYALGAAIITGISRLGYGVGGAAISRYSVMGALFAIATTALLFAILRGPEIAGRPIAERMRRMAMAAVAVPLLLAAAVNARSGFQEMERHGNRLESIAACTRQVRTPTDPCLQNPRSGRRQVQIPGIAFLRSKGWAGYSERPLTPVE